MIYVDNAATSWPKPESVYQAMDSFLREKGANPGRSAYSMAVAAEQVIEETRTLVARFFNVADAKDVVFTANCTDSLNLALKGLLRRGDHVVTDSIGHNSLVRPLRRLEAEGVQVTRVPPSPESGSISPIDVAAAITPATRLIAVTHASNVSGVIQPIEEIGEVAREHGVAFLVDAAQSAAVLPIDVRAANVDFLALSAHKGPLGPPGIGVLCLSERVDPAPLKEGGTGTASESEEQPSDRPSRYESGTPNSVGIAGMGAGLKFVLQKGVETIGRHERELAVRLLEGLAPNPKITVFGPSASANRIGVVSFRIDGWSPGEASAVLDQAFGIQVRSGLHCAPAAHKTLVTYPLGTVRASFGLFNTTDDVDALLDAITRIAKAEPAEPAANAQKTG